MGRQPNGPGSFKTRPPKGSASGKTPPLSDSLTKLVLAGVILAGVVVMCCFGPLAWFNRSWDEAQTHVAETETAAQVAIEEQLAFVPELPEVAWMHVEGTRVYVGFYDQSYRTMPIEGWAKMAANAAGERVTVWFTPYGTRSEFDRHHADSTLEVLKYHGANPR